MKRYKKTIKIPGNHELKIKIPDDFPTDEFVEVIILLKKDRDDFEAKIEELKKAMKDEVFLRDVEEVSEDFEIVDSEIIN